MRSRQLKSTSFLHNLSLYHFCDYISYDDNPIREVEEVESSLDEAGEPTRHPRIRALDPGL